MGFQDMPEVVHKAASSKGGKIRVKKGLAAIPIEQRKAIQSKGGKARYGNQSKKGAKQTQDSGGGNTPILEAVLGNIDGDNNTWSDSESKE